MGHLKNNVMLIGRDKEKQILQNTLYEEYSQFVAVYGRRRVGKTFLIREAFENRFDFQFTGAANLTARKQLVRFRRALKEHGQKDTPELTNWGDAFSELKRFIMSLPEGKKVVFLDELPWMDAPRSGFLSELESFWNGWASARKDIVFVVCGSSTSWMVKKIIKNKGGLHNRLNHRISLSPFPLGLCEEGGTADTGHVLEADFIGSVLYQMVNHSHVVFNGMDRGICDGEGRLGNHSGLFGVLHREFEVAVVVESAEGTGYVGALGLLHLEHQFAHIRRHWVHAEGVEAALEHVGLDPCLVEGGRPLANGDVRILAVKEIYLFESASVGLHAVEASHIYDSRGNPHELVNSGLIFA